MYRSALFTFWPITTADSWELAMSYKSIYDWVRQTGLPNYLEARIPGPNIYAWMLRLAEYPDVSLVDHLEFGWPSITPGLRSKLGSNEA